MEGAGSAAQPFPDAQRGCKGAPGRKPRTGGFHRALGFRGWGQEVGGGDKQGRVVPGPVLWEFGLIIFLV